MTGTIMIGLPQVRTVKLGDLTTDDVTWTLPFTQRSRDTYERQKMRTNLLMIEYWSQLGFIASAKFYVETDRTLPEVPDYPV